MYLIEKSFFSAVACKIGMYIYDGVILHGDEISSHEFLIQYSIAAAAGAAAAPRAKPRVMRCDVIWYGVV